MPLRIAGKRKRQANRVLRCGFLGGRLAFGGDLVEDVGQQSAVRPVARDSLGDLVILRGSVWRSAEKYC